MARHILAVCFDFGDTLCDEATEVKDDSLTTLRAELIPGAAEVLRELTRRGYPLALVADGRPGTYVNVLGQHGVLGLFDVLTVSELVGSEKPDARMFVTALDALGIARADYGRTLMVGNNLERDVKGANGVGMISVWIDWAPRRSKVPADAAEVPRYTIKQPLDLLPIVDQLEREPGPPAAWLLHPTVRRGTDDEREPPPAGHYRRRPDWKAARREHRRAGARGGGGGHCRC